MIWRRLFFVRTLTDFLNSKQPKRLVLSRLLHCTQLIIDIKEHESGSRTIRWIGGNRGNFVLYMNLNLNYFNSTMSIVVTIDAEIVGGHFICNLEFLLYCAVNVRCWLYTTLSVFYSGNILICTQVAFLVSLSLPA